MADPVKRLIEELRAAGAPDFFERDPAVWKASLKAKFEALTGRTLYPAQTEMFLIDTASYALSLLAEAAQTGVLQNTIVFAEGRHLEDRAANVSTYKLMAQPAVTMLRFTLSGTRLVATNIPRGTRVAAGDAVTFATDADLVIPAGELSGTVAATAQTAGATWNGLGIGNVVDILDPIAYVSDVSNVTDVTGGTDIEDPERFRLRGANALHTIAKTGPRAGYREHVKAVNPEIVDVEVIKPEPGFIHIYPLMKTGLPSAEVKVAILAYLDPETLRAMGDYVSVHDPEAVDFSMALTVRVSEAAAGQQALAEQAAATRFHPWTQELGAQVAPGAIIAAVKALPRVVDVELSGFAFTDLPAHAFARLTSVTANIVVASNV